VVKIERLILSEEDYDYLAKGIAIGAGVGVLIGLFVDNIILSFSAFTALGIIVSVAYSFYKKNKRKS
jgi:uncharacterized membrane protein YoaK (UPF0700 family)